MVLLYFTNHITVAISDDVLVLWLSPDTMGAPMENIDVLRGIFSVICLVIMQVLGVFLAT